MSPTSPPRSDLPTVEADTRLYWDAVKTDGKLLVARCGDCARVHHYPRPFCPYCWSSNVAPVEASGRGTLYTFSTVFVNDLAPFAERLPYVAAIVELDEGPKLMTTVIDCNPEDLRIGMPVRMRVQELNEEFSAPVFVPA